MDDNISRKAAIEAIKLKYLAQSHSPYGANNEFYRGISEAIEALTALPAVDGWLPASDAQNLPPNTQFQAWVYHEEESIDLGWWEPACRFNAHGAFEVWQRVDYDMHSWDAAHGFILARYKPLPTPPEGIDQ